MTPIKNEQLKWIGLDLDHTLAENSGYPDFELLKPMSGAKEFVDKIVEKDLKPIIYTARAWHEYNNIENWLDQHEIQHRRIICGKPLLLAMIDDKNIEFNGDWDEVEKKLSVRIN